MPLVLHGGIVAVYLSLPMQIVYSVIDEVYEHSVGAFIRLLLRSFVTENPAYEVIQRLPPPQAINNEVSIVSEIQSLNKVESAAPVDLRTNEVIPPATFRSLDNVMQERVVSPATPARHTVMYVGSTRAPLYQNPTEEFDGALRLITYGQLVMVLEERGRWSRVAALEHEGWMLRDDLMDRAAFVYPEFIIGEKNESDDVNTIRVRAFIDDEFGGERVECSLQAGEYVLYRLLRKGISIPWPTIRPRLPGRWHTILKGVPGIHIGITPKTGAVMEYVSGEEIGHVAYIEAVFPDETISISETNFPDNGVYNERMLTRAEWLELRPVFIQIL